jgi:vancomycin resistance protein YoaR
LEIKEKDLFQNLLVAIPELLVGTADSINLEIPVIYTDPQVTTQQVNNLGIKERIGVGQSLFKGSIPSRIHNVGLAASKISGTLLAPGEVFSFNKTLGDVSALTGYKQAYIIKDGKTVLGDGGGVCQVSTTLFRALLNAGLPINERAGHSYRVYYYEQGSSPGLDATVYDPSPDLKFTNDTNDHVLIQSIFEPKIYKLTVEIYGTSDGRIAETTKPVVSSVVAPADDLYIDDATLPIGTIKQTEHKSWGAKVTYDYVVKKNEDIIFQKKFITNYKPWQAVYLRGTAPI